MNGNICNFYFNNVLFKWFLELCYLSTNSFKFGIKMTKTSTCFPWYSFNLPYMKQNIWLLDVSRNLLLCEYCFIKQHIWVKHNVNDGSKNSHFQVEIFPNGHDFQSKQPSWNYRKSWIFIMKRSINVILSFIKVYQNWVDWKI